MMDGRYCDWVTRTTCCRQSKWWTERETGRQETDVHTHRQIDML